MKPLLSVIYALATIVGLTLGQISIREALPFPLNQLNLIFALTSILLLAYGNNRPLSIGLGATILLDTFSSAPFGLNSLSALTGLALFSWLLSTIFTNHSPGIIAISGFFSNLLYRLVWLILMTTLNLAHDNSTVLSFDLLQRWSCDILLTTIVLVILYVISTRFIKRLKPHYIDIHRSSNV